jgi:3-oxoacyl-[acyl-carrier protein] reductase
MLKNRWGRIVNVSSIIAFQGNPGQANYAAAKAGVIGLTKTLAREVASRNITVNAVAPGLVPTDLTTNLSEKQWAEIEKGIPMKRAGTPEEVASLISYLCSDLASYITGSVFTVDGGLTA